MSGGVNFEVLKIFAQKFEGRITYEELPSGFQGTPLFLKIRLVGFLRISGCKIPYC